MSLHPSRPTWFRGILPLACLFALPLAAQSKPAPRPTGPAGPQAIGPKPDDPRSGQARKDGMKPTGGRGPQAIGPKPDDPRARGQARQDGVKPAGGRGPQAIGPKPDDPRAAKPAPAAPKADPRQGNAKR